MHQTESVAVRTSLVVERDWLADEWVITVAQSDAAGNVLSSVRNAYSALEWDYVEIEALAYSALSLGPLGLR